MNRRARTTSIALLVLTVFGAGTCGGGGAESAAAPPPRAPASSTTTAVMGGRFTPAVSGQFTVQASLPAPGWWDGSDPAALEGGYEYEAAKQIATRLGYKKLVVKSVLFEDLIAGQTGDAVDLALSEVATSAPRAKVVDFTIPYFDVNQGVMVNKGTAVSAANLRGLRWGVESPSVAERFLLDRVRPDRKPLQFADVASLFAALEHREVDAILTDTVTELPRAAGHSAVVAGQFKVGDHYAGVVPKGSVSVGAINAVMRKMIDDGAFARLSAKWLQPALGGDPAKVPFLPVP